MEGMGRQILELDLNQTKGEGVALLSQMQQLYKVSFMMSLDFGSFKIGLIMNIELLAVSLVVKCLQGSDLTLAISVFALSHSNSQISH